jgi:hypothetical protein
VDASDGSVPVKFSPLNNQQVGLGSRAPGNMGRIFGIHMDDFAQSYFVSTFHSNKNNTRRKWTFTVQKLQGLLILIIAPSKAAE